MRNRLPMLLCSVAVGIVFAGIALTLLAGEAKAKPTVMVVNDAVPEAFPSVTELGGIYNEMRREDKAKVTAKTKKARMEKIKGLVSKGNLHNSADYFVGATIMAEGSSPEDALLTHDLALTALAMGDVRAKHLAAIGEDQFLIRTGRSQRFGTQTKMLNGRQILDDCDPTVNDGMRQALGLPSTRQSQQMLSEGKSPQSRIAQGPKKMMPVNTVQNVSLQ